MGYYDYTPLDSPYPMSWPARCCNLCGAAEVVWAYPVGEVTFPRRMNVAGDVQDVQHDAQPWYACTRCKAFVDTDRWDELAAELSKRFGYFDRLARARMETPGYRFAKAA